MAISTAFLSLFLGEVISNFKLSHAHPFPTQWFCSCFLLASTVLSSEPDYHQLLIHVVIIWGLCWSCHWAWGLGSFSLWGKKLYISLSLSCSLLCILHCWLLSVGVPHSPWFGDTSSVVLPISPQERSSSHFRLFPGLVLHNPTASSQLHSLEVWFLEMLIFVSKALTCKFCMLSVTVKCSEPRGPQNMNL